MNETPQMPETISFELASLAKAVNYQSWIFSSVESYLGSRIMEVGAGTGNMSRWMPLRDRLILTETDPTLFKLLSDLPQFRDNPKVSIRKLDLVKDDLTSLYEENLDTIVSFNVLEHIEDDFAVVEKMRKLLLASKAPGPKRLVTFVPAHQWAYGNMDRTLLHFRRYTRRRWKQIQAQVAPDAKLRVRHVNVLGLLGWFVQGRVMRKKLIGDASIKTFERICPTVRGVEESVRSVVKLPFGQSIVAILEWS